MKRMGFLLKVKEEKIAEYKRINENVWPEMCEAIKRTEWHNYSLFMREDGMLFGYFETPVNLQIALGGMSKEEISKLSI
jgi:L-rhamnose mutarotase